MATFDGTDKKDTITTEQVSAGVLADPEGALPSDEDDVVFGNLGNDEIETGGGADQGWGDTDATLDSGKAGKDKIDTGDGDDVSVGDADVLEGNAKGGKDTINTGDGNDTVYGDGIGTNGDSKGGNDKIEAGDGDDTVYGEGLEMRDNAKGGNDRIDGGAGNDQLWGDADDDQTDATAQGGKDKLHGGDGDDILIGGGGKDKLWGDDGNDIFGFAANSGKDQVKDFVRGEDVLDFGGYGLTFDDLDTNDDEVVDKNDDFSKGNKSLKIDLGEAAGDDGGVNVVKIAGVGELDEADILGIV